MKLGLKDIFTNIIITIKNSEISEINEICEKCKDFIINAQRNKNTLKSVDENRNSNKLQHEKKYEFICYICKKCKIKNLRELVTEDILKKREYLFFNLNKNVKDNNPNKELGNADLDDIIINEVIYTPIGVMKYMANGYESGHYYTYNKKNEKWSYTYYESKKNIHEGEELIFQGENNNINMFILYKRVIFDD